MDDWEKILTYWSAMLFVHDLSTAQIPNLGRPSTQSPQRKGCDKKTFIEDLIAGIQDEARRSERTDNNSGKSDATKALNLYGKQPAKKAAGQCKKCAIKETRKGGSITSISPVLSWRSYPLQ